MEIAGAIQVDTELLSSLGILGDDKSTGRQSGQ